VAEKITLVTQGVSKRQDYQRAEAELLRGVRRLIREGGFSELTMARLAEVTGYTRKTVYNHFANIEDAVAAASVQSIARRADLVARAALFRGRSRERLAAVGAVAGELLPYHMRHEILLTVIRQDRVPDHRLRRLRSQEERALAVNIGLVRDGVAAGDLVLPPDVAPEEIALTLFQIVSGPVMISLRGWGVGEYSTRALREVFDHTLNVLVDDLGWKPLSTEFDYGASIRRMWRELFPEELEKFDSPLLRTGR
jgi:AcrR family transcriptional regulator